MKSSLKKLRGLALHKHDSSNNNNTNNSKTILPLGQRDELAQATREMQDMRDCYDTLLSAAAATASSAYEFAESLRDMGSCLLEKTALNDHEEETGKVLLMLGKIQFKLQKLIDNYRSHIIQTITVPSESLLNELRIVEEMKRQCDEKRDVYEYMVTKYRERGRSKGGKGETFTLQQLQSARDEYDEEATLFVFRLKSLKQGQSRSLLTQAARHNAAQTCFFKKAAKFLETVEPHVKSVTEQQHIDYHFSGLEEEDGDEGDDEEDDDNGYDENDDGELSFDYGHNEQEQDVSTSQNSMELDQVELTLPRGSSAEAAKENLDKLQKNLFSFRVRTGSQSAPLFPDNKPDPSEKLRQMRPSLSRKFNSYVLPTPKSSNNPKPTKMQTNLNEPTKNLWYSSPLEQKKPKKDIGEEHSGPSIRNAQSVLRESNSNAAFSRLPLPLVDSPVSLNHDNFSAYSKKIKRHAFSGPLTSNPWPTRPVSMDSAQFSGPLLPTRIPQPPAFTRSGINDSVVQEMSPAGELWWLCRCVDESLSSSTEPRAFVSTSKENEKEILIASSQVVRKIQLRIREFDPSWNKEELRGSEEHCSIHQCLPKIVTKLVNLLAVENEFVQHVAVNALVLISEFVFATGNNWDEFIHLLCCSLEMAFTRMLPFSSEHNNSDSSDVDFVLQHGVMSCDWSTVAGIVGVLRVICKHLKDDYDDELVKVYYDSVNSCLLKMPWNSLDECWSCDIVSMKKRLLVNEELHSNLGAMDPGIRFLGTFLRLLCSLVDRNDFEETGCDSDDKLPLFVTIMNLIPRLVKWCLRKQEDNSETCIIHYMKHKLLILMIRLGSLSCLDSSDSFSWLEILHNYFQELLLQPLTQFLSAQGDCLEGSPFLLSLSDGETYGTSSSHLQRQAIFLLLDCSISLISQRGSKENHSDYSALSSCFTNNPDPEFDHFRIKKGLLELYKWIQEHLPSEVSINHENYSEICMNFTSSFLQLYLHEDDLLFEVLLQLLSISSCLQQLSGRKDVAYQDVKRDFHFDLSDIFNPVCLFHLFLSEIHYDHQVLLDYLISKDTGISCAKYLLRCLHLICNSWKLFVEFPFSGDLLNQSSCKRRKLLGDDLQFVADETPSVDNNGCNELHIKNLKEDSEYDFKHHNTKKFKKAAECLLSLNNSIGNLHQKSLFPYSPEVLLKRLRRFQELCCHEKLFDRQKLE